MLLCALAVLLAACDASRDIVIANQSSQVVMVGRYRFLDSGVESSDVVSVPAGSRVSLGKAGVFSDALLKRVLLMDADCAMFADEVLSDGRFSDAVLITVDPDLIVTVTSVGMLDSGSPPVLSDLCEFEVEEMQ